LKKKYGFKAKYDILSMCLERLTGWLSKKIKTRWFQGITVGVICFFIGMCFSYWLVFYSLDIQERAYMNEIKILEPNVSIDVHGIDDNTIKIILQSENSGSAKIDELFFIFDIPGVFQSISDEYADKVSGCTFVNQFKTGKWNTTYSEYIIMECHLIYPKGYYDVKINYIPTNEIVDTAGNYSMVYMPYMDLWDFPFYTFSWVHQGNTQIRDDQVNLTHLNYIMEDNENWIYRETCKNPNGSQRIDGLSYSCCGNMSCWLDFEYFLRFGLNK